MEHKQAQYETTGGGRGVLIGLVGAGISGMAIGILIGAIVF